MNSFTFSVENEKVFKDFLSKVGPKHVEFEIRFGKINYNPTTKTSNFESNVDIDFFYTLQSNLRKHNIPTKELDTTETIYSNNIKEIKNNITHEIHYIQKNTFKKYDIYDYDIRLSLANERIIHDNVNKDKIELVRNKKRTSYMFEFGHLDLTIVDSTKYEVELEITKPQLNDIFHILGMILQTRQKNYYVISNYEKKRLRNQYKQLFGTPFFIGAQAETLQKHQLTNLYKTSYSVTDKADGERTFLFIDDSKCVYLIDSNLQNIWKTNLSSTSYFSSVIDGELIIVENQIHFYAFDMLAYNGKDVRGNNQFLLTTRLETLSSILSTIQSNDLYKIFMKQFIYKNVFLGSEILLEIADNKPYKNDGLIYTPMDEPYPTTKKWSHLLKWKPAELNTIDFYAIQEGSDWYLYVQAPNKSSESKSTSLVLFDIEQLCNQVSNGSYTYKTIFDPNLLDPMTGEPFKSNTVIEFQWNTKEQKFVPLRTRWDKTANPKKHGNFSSVACDIWHNIHNPVEKEMLFKFTAMNDKNDLHFSRMRKFHNRVKENLYNKYCNNIEYLLELCSGKGGDLHKWLYNNIAHVTGYDISDKHIEECQRRIKGLNNDKTKDYTFLKANLSCPSTCEQLKYQSSHKYDVACCHFGIHYFFESEHTLQNLLHLVDNKLKDNGFFIVTFIDNEQLNALMDEQKIKYRFTDNNEIAYFLKTNSTQTSYGNSLNIVLNGNNILGEGSFEYIINYEHFKSVMEKLNYTIVESKLFKECCDISGFEYLSTIEKDISFLNRYCVFKKTNQNSDLKVSLTHNISKPYPASFDIDTIDLYIHELQAIKVTHLYDVIDIVNCIEYRYNKYTVDNKLIESYDDIVNLTCFLNCFSPIFIDNPINLDSYQGKTKQNLAFTYKKHVLEKKGPDNSIETIEFDNWYILLCQNKLLFDFKDLQQNDNVTTPAYNSTSDTPTQQIDIDSLTIVKLKEILKEKGLKVTGKKEELKKRLIDSFK